MHKAVESKRGQRGPALLAAAEELFVTQGYAQTTMEQVAREAGFSKRTVYLYFKNKDELFIAVAEQGLIILRETLEGRGIGRMDIPDAIDAILEIYLDFAREYPTYFNMIFREVTPQMIANSSEELRARVEEHEWACLGVVVEVIERAKQQQMIGDVDPLEVAGIFWGTATGILLLSMGGSQTVFARKTREELIEKATWVLYEGLLATAPPGK